MEEVRPIRERELLIDDDIRLDLRNKIDPLINGVLESRGYIEDHTPAGRINLDGEAVFPSPAYLSHFKSPFDALDVRTTENFYDNSPIMTNAALRLIKIGGFGSSHIVKTDFGYKIKTLKANEDPRKVAYSAVKSADMADILEDIRAHTSLGYSNHDTASDPVQIIRELDNLHDIRNVDRRANYEILTSPDHGEIKLNVGESFELRKVKNGGELQDRRFNAKKVFELLATQPLEEGEALVGVHYRSGRKSDDMSIKLTAEIIGTNYTDEQKQFLYNDILLDYQERDMTRFGRGVIQNLQHILDNAPDVMRLN